MIRTTRDGSKGDQEAAPHSEALRSGVSRRALLTSAAVAVGGAAVAWTILRASPSVARPTVTVWKSSDCTCCGGWVAYMRKLGYKVDVNELEDVASKKAAQGIPEELWSCHTSKIGDYLIEGHVPEPAIAKLLTEGPNVKGLALPGMEPGSPGMGGAPGTYRVLAFDRDGRSRLFLITGG